MKRCKYCENEYHINEWQFCHRVHNISWFNKLFGCVFYKERSGKQEFYVRDDEGNYYENT